MINEPAMNCIRLVRLEDRMEGLAEDLEGDTEPDQHHRQMGCRRVVACEDDHGQDRHQGDQRQALDREDVAVQVVERMTVAGDVAGDQLLGAEPGDGEQHRAQRQPEDEVAEATLAELTRDRDEEDDRRRLRHELPDRADQRRAGDSPRGRERGDIRIARDLRGGGDRVPDPIPALRSDLRFLRARH
jgi:hypothetical protein